LGSIENAQPIIVRVLPKLAGTKNVPPGLLEKLTESLAGKPPAKNESGSIVVLLGSSSESVRNAAATCLVRSAEESVRARIIEELASEQAERPQALLGAISRLRWILANLIAGPSMG
jgi:hypothetical protein